MNLIPIATAALVCTISFNGYATVDARQTCEVIPAAPEVIIEPTEQNTSTGLVCSANLIPLYDVPLSEEIQTYIISISAMYKIDHKVVIAMIETESNYHLDIIGDHGNAIGCMQVWECFNKERAERLNADLYTVKGNILIGIDILHEKLEQHGWDYLLALTAYNTGNAQGGPNDYAYKVLGIAENLFPKPVQDSSK